MRLAACAAASPHRDACVAAALRPLAIRRAAASCVPAAEGALRPVRASKAAAHAAVSAHGRSIIDGSRRGEPKAAVRNTPTMAPAFCNRAWVGVRAGAGIGIASWPQHVGKRP
jgi:hypothetical protein